MFDDSRKSTTLTPNLQRRKHAFGDTLHTNPEPSTLINAKVVTENPQTSIPDRVRRDMV
jgi:hypothetical protein